MFVHVVFAFTNEVFYYLKELSPRAIGRIHFKLKNSSTNTKRTAYSERNVAYLIVK